MDDGIKRFWLYKNSRYSLIIILRLTKISVYRFEFLSPFLCSLQRKEGKRKGNGGKKNRQGGRSARPRTDWTKENLENQTRKTDFSFVQSVRLLTISFPLPDPPSSRVLVQKDPSSPVADGSYRPMCSSLRYAHAFLLPFYVKSTPCAEEICADTLREMM